MCKSQNKCAYNKKVFSFISLNIVQFSFRPILNPGPSQSVPLLRFCLSSNLADMVIIRKSELSSKNFFCPVLLVVRCGRGGGYFCTFLWVTELPLANVSFLTWQMCHVSGKCVKSHLANVSFSCKNIHLNYDKCAKSLWYIILGRATFWSPKWPD